MPALRLREFRVTNFRNIDDSGWIPLEQVTALVGRNESGKTALLKALHRFNPASPESYSPQRDFPRDRFTRDFRNGANWPVCSVRFDIDPELLKRIPSLLGHATPATVTVTRYYDASLAFAFDPLVAEPGINRDVLERALHAFRTASTGLAAPTSDEEPNYQSLRTALLTWCDTCTDRLTAHLELKSNEGIAILEAIRSESNSHARPETATAIGPLQDVLNHVIQDIRAPTISEQLESLIRDHMPVFIYFENYGILDSAIFLPRFLTDANHTPPTPQVRTIKAMFEHVGLNADELHTLGQSEAETNLIRHGQQASPELIAQDRERKELRSIKLNSASNDITQRFGSWWKQRRHKIRYEADGEFFRIWISDDRRPNVDIELEARSKGFQWFFSFYLVFLVESEQGHKDAVLLLDEPGLHLHPTAQEELIAFFEELSQKNPIIYSTHSPWLIDGQHLERVRPVTEDSSGHSRISVGEWPRDRETIFPLQGAAGYAMVRTLFRHKKNVLVEGLSDYFYLHLLSLLCRQAGKAALPDDVYITPCGGTKLVGHLASLFLGQSVRPLVLLDGDEAGAVRRDALLKELYCGYETAIVMLDEIYQQPGSELEDLIGEKRLLPVLNEFLTAKLTFNNDDRASGSFPDQVKASAKRHAILLPDGWKPELARRIASKWATVHASELEPEILERAAMLFDVINRRFDRLHNEQPMP